MTRPFTFKSALAALLLTCFAQIAFAQPFWTETFSDQASSTTNWPSGGTNAGPETWKWTNVLNAGNWQPGNFNSPTGSTGYMWFDSDANGDGNAHDVTLTGVGVPANCTGKSNVHLKFYTYFRTFSGTDVARVGVSTDGTNFTYINVPQFDDLKDENTFGPQVYHGWIDIPLPQADNQAQVWIQFRYTGTFEYYWKVDDIELNVPVGPIPCDQNPAAIICDNFESYTIGNVSPQAAHWVPWSLNDADPVSAEVSADYASQGTKSMKVKLDGAGDDQLLKLGNKSAGRYSLKWKQYVPTGNAAYINVQTDENAPGAASANFSFQCYFNADGTTTMDIPTPATAGSYPHDKWFTVEFVMDLDNNLAKFFVDGKLARAWTYTQNFGAIDFYAADASYLFYVDEVEYINLPTIVYNADVCDNAVDLSLYFGISPGIPQTTGIYNNTTATADPTDPPAPNCWADGIPTVVPKIDGSMWYTFTGDGGTYHIETVPCSSTDYIDDGDTQMAIYTGECGNFNQILCNEDLTGAADYRSGLDIETTSGTNYYILIDGWSTQTPAPFVAQGEFCIEITQKPSIGCDAGQVGTYAVSNNGFVCDNTLTGALFTLDNASFVLPTIGPVYGVCWAITTEPVPPGTWPPTLATYWGSFAVSPNLYVPNLNNNGNPLTQNAIWYFTPVVVAGAVDTIPANAAFLHQLNIDDACYFVGESTPLIMLDELAPLDATWVVTPPTGGNNNGAIDLTVTGGFFDLIQDPSAYTVEWSGPNSFTASTEDISNLAPGTYSVTVTDISGCADPFEITIDVTSAVKDPASVKSLTLTPNPTADFTTLNLTLANTADVRIEVVNTLGQTLQTLDAGKVNVLNQRVDLSRFSNGTYFLRLTINGETAIRRVVVQH